MREQFTGTWRLAIYDVSHADGSISHPYGQPPQGVLMYDAEGFMAVQIMRPDRPVFAINDRWMGTLEEMKAAFHGYISYYGRYTVDAEQRTVTHHVEGSVFPNYIGRNLVRQFDLDGDTLTLSTPPMPFGGEKAQGRLVWVRQ